MTAKRNFIVVMITLILVSAAVGQTAQTATDYVAKRVQFQVLNPPQPVPNAGGFVTGNPGPVTYYYWIVTTTLLGNSSPAGPFAVSNVPNTLTVSNFVQVSWGSVGDAISYDVLRTTSSGPPFGACNCAVATAVSTTSTNDQSNTLNAYTVNTLNTSSLTIVLQNVGGTLSINGPLNLNGFGLTAGGVTNTGNEKIGGGTTTAPTGNALIGGGSPWFDVTAPPWNATCDGVTDDTAAINNALTRANAVGSGAVLIPAGKTCVFSSQLNMDQFFHVGLVGAPSTGIFYSDSGSAVKPKLIYTGTASPAIKARSASGLIFRDIEILYNNAAFTGSLIDTSHVIAADSQGDLFDNVLLQGTATAQGATALLFLQNSDNFEIRKSSFHNAVNAINAVSVNLLSVHDSNFGSAAGDISGAYILGGGPQMTIGPNNDFEMAPIGVTVWDCTLGCQRVNTFIGNMLEDTLAGYNGTAFKNLGSTGAGQFVFIGNNFLGGANHLGTLFSTTGAPEAITITGNAISNWNTVISGNCCNVGELIVLGNAYSGTIGTFMTGSPQNAANLGTVVDNTGKVTFYTANNGLRLAGGGIISAGAAATFTGSTGACSTTGTQSGGSFAGRITCTAATAASTLVVVPGGAAPNGWICTAFDQTTRANLLQQTATSTTSCTMTATSITQNDVIVFQAIAF